MIVQGRTCVTCRRIPSSLTGSLTEPAWLVTGRVGSFRNIVPSHKGVFTPRGKALVEHVGEAIARDRADNVSYYPDTGGIMPREKRGAVEDHGGQDIDFSMVRNQLGKTAPDISTTMRSPSPYVISLSRSHRNIVDATFLSLISEGMDFVVDYCGSSLKFCRVAKGRTHFYARRGPTMEWETAAGNAILTSAGGKVVG